jgi:PKHD-type hydroxylase
MKIGLAMIAKDEESTIGRALESIRDHIDVVCMDLSGTTDQTQMVAERHLMDKDQYYFNDDWLGAAKAYNRCIQWLQDQGCDWIVRLDADTIFVIEDEFPDLSQIEDEYDGIKIECWELGRYVADRMWITRPECRYRGIRHEGMFCENTTKTMDLRIEHFNDSGARPRTKETYLSDAEAILSDLRAVTFDQDQGGDDTSQRMISRYAFYLANSYHDGGDLSNALVWYRARSLMRDYFEEVEFSLIRIASLTQDRGDILRMLELSPHRPDAGIVAIRHSLRSEDPEWMDQIWEIVKDRHWDKGRMFCDKRLAHDASVMKERLRSVIMADDGIKQYPAWLLWESAIDDETCDRWIKIGQQQAEVNAKTFNNSDDSVRKTQVRWIYNQAGGNEIFRKLWEYLDLASERMGVKIDDLPPIQYTEYADVGHHYDTHHDIDWNRQDGRHRKISIVVNLTDPSEYVGGDFAFLTTDHPDPVALKKRGSILCFLSYQEHKVTPIEAGQRTSLVAWAEGERWQ